MRAIPSTVTRVESLRLTPRLTPMTMMRRPWELLPFQRSTSPNLGFIDQHPWVGYVAAVLERQEVPVAIDDAPELSKAPIVELHKARRLCDHDHDLLLA